MMADVLTLPQGTLDELATGQTIVAITGRNAVDLNDEVELLAAGDAETGLFALVVAVQPAASLIDETGDAVLLRVFRGAEPVLGDEEFSARRAGVEAQWR